MPNIHELSTRTVNMSRDQLLEGGQGFGICVKGGRDAGERYSFLLFYGPRRWCQISISVRPRADGVRMGNRRNAI